MTYNFMLKSILSIILLLSASITNAQNSDEEKADSTKLATKELPLEPKRKISFNTQQGTWISVDVHPDGKTLIFDLMGNLYTIPITGG